MNYRSSPTRSPKKNFAPTTTTPHHEVLFINNEFLLGRKCSFFLK